MFNLSVWANQSATQRRGMLVSCGVAALLLLGQLLARADSVVTTTSASDLQAALYGGGTVTLSFDGTVSLTTPLNLITNTTINASGHTVTITGNNAVQMMTVPANVTCLITNLTILSCQSTGKVGTAGAKGSNGSTGQSGGPGGNGADGTGGAIINQGTLVLANCRVSTNTVIGGNGGAGGTGGNGSSFAGGNGGNAGNGGNGYGGGVYNQGVLLLTNCTFSGNKAIGGNGGVGGTNGSGGLESYAGAGGVGAIGAGAGVYNVAGSSVTVVNCTFDDNSSVGGSSQTAGTTSNNHNNGLPGAAGAVSLGAGLCNIGTGTIINSTFFANIATGGNGGNGGLGDFTGGNGGAGGTGYGGSLYNVGSLGVTNCTLSGGSAVGGANGLAGAGPFTGSDGAPGVGRGDNIANLAGVFSLKNSILAAGVNGMNSFGTITDRGFNISSDATPVLGANSRGSLNPKLGVPFNNGGPTLTMALLSLSPALDKGSLTPLPFDQRGAPRPQGSDFDIGAFESGATLFTISGHVAVDTNNISGLSLVLTSSGNSPVTKTNDATGNFSFTSLAPGSTFTVTPQPAGFFTPANRSVTITSSNILGVDFTNTTLGKQIIMGTGTVTGSTNATNQAFQLSFHVFTNWTYRVQASTNLSSPTNWHDIYTNRATNGVISLTLTNNPTNTLPKQFFRTIYP